MRRFPIANSSCLRASVPSCLSMSRCLPQLPLSLMSENRLGQEEIHQLIDFRGFSRGRLNRAPVGPEERMWIVPFLLCIQQCFPRHRYDSTVMNEKRLEILSSMNAAALNGNHLVAVEARHPRGVKLSDRAKAS